MEFRRMLIRLAVAKQRAIARKQGLKPRKFKTPRGRDGLTAFDVQDAEDVFVRLARCAEESVRWKLSGAVPERPMRDGTRRRRRDRAERRRQRAQDEWIAAYEAEQADAEAALEERIREYEASGW